MEEDMEEDTKEVEFDDKSYMNQKKKKKLEKNKYILKILKVKKKNK